MSEKKPLSRSELEVIIKKRAAIWITILAALLAVNTMFGGANSSKIMGNTIASNNLWSWYGEKKIDAKQHEIMAKVLAADNIAQNDKLIGQFLAEAHRLRTEPGDGMDALKHRARALEAERDQAAKRSPYFTFAGMALQLGIVLSTAAILAVALPMFYASLAAGSAGVVLFAIVQLGA